MTTKNLELPVSERIPTELLLRHSTPALDWQLATPNPVLRVGGMSPYRPTRREFLVGAGSLLILAPFGCSGGSGEGGGDAASGARTVEHKYGSTEVSGNPERVVSVGYNDQDTLLAFGVAPVGVREWFGEYPSATWPWAQDELGDADPEIVADAESINFEAVANAAPDLIVGVSSGMTREDYDTLSEIAPTLPQTDEYIDFGVPWQEQVRLTGRALGMEDRAGEIVADIEDRFAEARERHPEFEGATGLVAARYEGYSVYGPDDVRGRFLADLGFEIPREVAELVGDDFFSNVSEERLALLDVDMLTMFVNTREEIEETRNNPLFSRLPVAEEGRTLFYETNSLIAGALSFSSPLSLPYLLENYVPQMAAAVDGDPATEAGDGPDARQGPETTSS